MSFVPCWSPYTLTGRGKLVLSPFDLLAVVESELEIIDNCHNIERIFRHAVAYRQRPAAGSSDSEDDTMSQPDSNNSGDSDCDDDGDVMMLQAPCDLDADVTMLEDSDLDSDDEHDSDFMPSAEWCNGFIEHFSPHILRARAPPSPLALAGLSPVPDVLTRAHMMALGFRIIKWDE
jgi:hypothetical protein